MVIRVRIPISKEVDTFVLWVSARFLWQASFRITLWFASCQSVTNGLLPEFSRILCFIISTRPNKKKKMILRCRRRVVMKTRNGEATALLSFLERLRVFYLFYLGAREIYGCINGTSQVGLRGFCASGKLERIWSTSVAPLPPTHYTRSTHRRCYRILIVFMQIDKAWTSLFTSN